MDCPKFDTPLEAAVAAARDFKHLLDIQPPGALFFPGHQGDVRTTATYACASGLLELATQDLQGTKGIGFERRVGLPVPRVVADQGADVPAQHFQLFASVTAAIAQLAFQVLDESGGGTKHGGLLEIGIRYRGEVDQPAKLVEGKGDAIHEPSSKKVVEQPLCHDATTSGEVR